MAPYNIIHSGFHRTVRIGAIALVLISTMDHATAQRTLVDSREQAEGWYLPVHGEVTIDGKATDGYSILLYKNNEPMGEVPTGKNKRFELELDIDQVYTVRVTKEGYQEKMLTIDTKLPEGLVKYPDYECFINLQPVNASGVDAFYTDFPSAIIRYDETMNGFYHSEHYLDHIQTRLAGIATATF
ncbi:MAG TPA: hypothetical protein PK760_10665 [Flavobacteriales bacterium]|nr:hypothetical protein [Flavobacteriales bacterium]